jgi:predicted methyltransferase
LVQFSAYRWQYSFVIKKQALNVMNQQIRLGILLCMVAVLSACAANGTGRSGFVGDARVTSPARPIEDVARDAGRKPFAVLDFLGVEQGMTTLDVMAAGGYYTEVLARVVGPQGRVYAQNPAVMLRFGGGRNDRALTDRLLGNRLANVRRLDREFDDLGLVAASVDVAITALNFHDIYNNSPEAAQGVLLAIKQVLKPGGVFGIIDHVGNPGADQAATNKTLHRIDPALVVSAAEQAGFTVERSNLLSNPDDDHTQNPFAPGLRGNTDRFVLKLTKR